MDDAEEGHGQEEGCGQEEGRVEHQTLDPYLLIHLHLKIGTSNTEN